MPTRATITAEVQTLVGRATSEQGVHPIAEYVDLALRDVDRASPRAVKLTLTGDGTDEYALSSPWERGFSVVTRVRSVPSADFNAPAAWLTPDQYEVEYDSTGAGQIRLAISPTSSDRVVVEHTARHTLTEATATTTLNDTETGALARRAAALLLRAAAASVATTVPQGTDEDFADFGNAADAYRRLADDMDAEYRSLLGLPEPGSKVAGAPVLVTVPAQAGRRNWSRLTHPRTGAPWRG